MPRLPLLPTDPTVPSELALSSLASRTDPEVFGRLVQSQQAASFETLRMRLFTMGTLVEELVRDSVIALTQQNMALAATIIPRDDQVDCMEAELETLCLHLLERPQSSAYEVRLVSTALKLINDIERIGDHAVDIARVAQRMEREMILYKPLVDVPRIGEMVRCLLHDALNAFLHRDLHQAKQTIHADANVDRLYGRMRRDLQKALQTEPGSVLQSSYLLFVIHYIERIGDHCVGIAERICFLETGKLPTKASSTKLS